MTAQLECGSHLPSESECKGDYRTGYRNVSHCQENSLIQDYIHPDNHTQSTYEMTPGFKLFTGIMYPF